MTYIKNVVINAVQFGENLRKADKHIPGQHSSSFD